MTGVNRHMTSRAGLPAPQLRRSAFSALCTESPSHILSLWGEKKQDERVAETNDVWLGCNG